MFTFVSIAFSAFSQKVESDAVSNGVRRIQSKSETIDFENFFRYNLEKFICGDKSQYFIRCRSEENEYHNFPCNCKLLFKTYNGKIVELTSVISELVGKPVEKKMFSTSMTLPIAGKIWEPTAYYPITQEQLEDLFTGIAKIRVEMLSYNKKTDQPFMDYPEMEFKKDKLGKQFKEMFDNIEGKELTQPKIIKEPKNKKQDAKDKTSLERKKITDDF